MFESRSPNIDHHRKTSYKQTDLFDWDYTETVIKGRSQHYRCWQLDYALRGGGLGFVLASFLGPVAAVVALTIGLALGLFSGFQIEQRRLHRHKDTTEKQLEKVRHLMRFSNFH
eukprot:Lankesteria_metandrocarpae@DN7848_c0_g1_i1.p1